MGCVAGGHRARSGAMGTWWALSQQLPAPASPGARLGGGWTGTSASAGGCSPKSHPHQHPATLCSPSSPSPRVSPIPAESPGDGLSRGQGSLFCRTPIPGARAHGGANRIPGTQGTKACYEHLCPCPDRPPGSAPVFSSNRALQFPPVGLQPLLKPRGCWGYKILA